MRLIDADAAIDFVDAGHLVSPNEPRWSDNEVVAFLKSRPTIERKKGWIPVTTRPMDEEERKEWSEKIGYELEGDDAVIYTSQLPNDGQECIVCTKWGNVFIDTFQNDPDYGCYFEDHGDMDGITAWMPLPKPWRGEKDEQ